MVDTGQTPRNNPSILACRALPMEVPCVRVHQTNAQNCKDVFAFLLEVRFLFRDVLRRAGRMLLVTLGLLLLFYARDGTPLWLSYSTARFYALYSKLSFSAECSAG